MRKISLVGIILIATIALTGCQGKKHFAPAPPPPDPEPIPAQFIILTHSLTSEWIEGLEKWESEVIGTVRNDGSTATPIIRARFYDEEGTQVGSSTDGLWDMLQGEVRKFEIHCYSQEEVKSYEVWVDKIWEEEGG